VRWGPASPVAKPRSGPSDDRSTWRNMPSVPAAAKVLTVGLMLALATARQD